MFDCTITVRGWLGGDVDLRRAGDVPVASFRFRLHAAALQPAHRDLGATARPSGTP